MADGEITGSRVKRAASMAGAAAGVAARKVTAKAVSGRSESRQAAAANQQLKSAEALVRVLGGMRGAAMKIGQTLSAVDLGLVPEEIRPAFQEILATLQQDADPISFKALTKVVDGRPRRDGSPTTSRDFAEEPLGSRLDRSGPPRDAPATVATSRSRSSTPGIAEAIHADLQEHAPRS